MYSAKPNGINIKVNDRKVKDGLLQESINMQWRNESLRPIPNRLISDIDTSGYSGIIFHKVGDEDQINVLGFKSDVTSVFLAFDLAEYLAGSIEDKGVLTWFGTITDGVYAPIAELSLGVFKTPGLTFTVLNGLLYFMGDGSTTTEQFYTRLQFNQVTGFYESKDMYDWKSLIPFYPAQVDIELTGDSKVHNIASRCGLILIRFALVLKSGEIVLHSPIFGNYMYAITTNDEEITADTIAENIHTIVNQNLEFSDNALLDEEISAINIYAAVPYYESTIGRDDLGAITYGTYQRVSDETLKNEFQRMAEQPFYLVKTISKPTDDKIIFTVGDFSLDIDIDGDYVEIDTATIAAGEIMPVDNFTYQKIYGRITSSNGRLIVEKPTTVLSPGHARTLAVLENDGDVGFTMDTEDGSVNGIAYRIDKAIGQVFSSGTNRVHTRGLASYPDARANSFGGGFEVGAIFRILKCRKNTAHNLSCAFNIYRILSNGINNLFTFVQDPEDSNKWIFTAEYGTTLYYDYDDSLLSGSYEIVQALYSSENRAQFSAPGEFSVWPAINSYRIGEGKIMRVGVNSVNPADADVVSPLIVGTSDGIYTINLDPTGSILVASITKTKNIPFISSEILQVDGNIVFVSDKGLMAINNGDPVNLTKDFFPDQGNGNFPVNETVFPSYNTLTADIFGGDNPYVLDDIISYMKGALLAYDARRKTIWCSNPDYNFSLLFSVRNQSWGMSTLVFDDAPEYYGQIGTAIGDVYTRFMVKGPGDNLLILSGEDLDTEVDYHTLTRSIKFQNPDNYKKIERMFSRCLLLRSTAAGYFSFGVWGRQDNNKYKKALLIASKKDDTAASYPNDIRQDIPINCRKGKYKSIVILQSGKALPDSSIDSFDFEAMLVDNSRMR